MQRRRTPDRRVSPSQATNLSPCPAWWNPGGRRLICTTATGCRWRRQSSTSTSCNAAARPPILARPNSPTCWSTSSRYDDQPPRPRAGSPVSEGGSEAYGDRLRILQRFEARLRPGVRLVRTGLDGVLARRVDVGPEAIALDADRIEHLAVLPRGSPARRDRRLLQKPVPASGRSTLRPSLSSILNVTGQPGYWAASPSETSA